MSEDITFREEMTQLKRDGTLARMYARGALSHKPIYYLDIVNDLRDKGLTYQQLSERLGVSTKTIQRAVSLYK